MNAGAHAELNSIIRELDSIIRELDDISGNIRRDFVGIGNNQCANCIDTVTNQYRWAKRKLDNMDTSTVTESYAKSHGCK